MSVKYTFKLRSNWCRAKLWDLSEKTVVTQYHSLICVIPVKTLYFFTEITKKKLRKYQDYTHNSPVMFSYFQLFCLCKLVSTIKLS